MNNVSYDSSRKTGVTQTFKASDGNNIKKVFMPVPYNIGFELNILAKLNDDALQIIEQILPYFQPSFNLTVDLVKSIGEKRDIPIVLDSINFQDDYEGESSSGLIKKVQIDYSANTDVKNSKREVRYTVTPDPIDAGPDDDFGFSETTSFFSDSKSYSPTRQTDI